MALWPGGHLFLTCLILHPPNVRPLLCALAGAQCQRVRGGAGDPGGHGWPGALHPGQPVGPDQGAGAAQLEQPDQHPLPQPEAGEAGVTTATLPG